MFKAYNRALGVLFKKPVMLWGLSLLSSVMIVIGFLVAPLLVVVGIIVSYLITCGMAKVYMDGLEEKQVNSDQLFACFNKGFLRVAGGMAWRDLWLIIWGLISMIPIVGWIVGPIVLLVKTYSYRFVPYILITKPEVSATQALRLSMKMTKGMKGRMFAADIVIYIILFFAFLILGLLSGIEVIGVLFSIVTVVAAILVAALFGIFTGLYQASFYEEKLQQEAALIAAATAAASSEESAQ